ncbi:MAG TPA: hypothetical protein DEF45_14590 [Rhodopirellula sp.]|nr:MAG: hypothetical protein CBD74_09420 [Saprospirales bacterium TMED214]HBV64238.1 hypothetical protein [Rhodopirellula sp.]
MLLIATDEAGYGPKLGPLIITGTAWEVQGHPDRESLDRLFQPLREPHLCGEISVVVDDSKAIFKPSSGLAGLHAVVSACMHWCKRPENSLLSALPWLAARDLESIRSTAWLDMQGRDTSWVSPSETRECLESWQSTGLRLVGVSSRVITARAFNEFCASGTNKADLLSQTTLGLVKTLMGEHQGSADFVDVYCDRHGGRRYYAGVLQHVFPEHLAQVHSETAKESSYVLSGGGPNMSVRFTVKGDRFSPVALASMHAKYLRERCMQAFNHYFADRHIGKLKPTAGYPADADRFLADITAVVEREKINCEHLIRAR